MSVPSREQVSPWALSCRSTAAPPWRTPRASSASPGGSSRPRRPATQVCVVVSAMGDTTDELLDLAEQVTPLPPGRELDMLLTAGERISMALLAMAINNLGHEAQSFTGSQAGVITDAVHGKARIIDVDPGPDPDRPGRGPHRDRRRLPGRQPGHQGHHHPRPRRLGHHRRGPGRRARRRRLRDLHRRRRRLHRRPADRRRAPARSTGSPARRCWSWPRPAPRSCTCAASSTPAASTCRSTSAPRSASTRAPGSPTSPNTAQEGESVEQPIISGVAHDRTEAKITVVGVPDTPGKAAAIFQARRRRRDQHRHDRPERLRVRRPAGPTSPSRCRRPTARRPWRPSPRSRSRSASRPCSTTTRSASSR